MIPTVPISIYELNEKNMRFVTLIFIRCLSETTQIIFIEKKVKIG
jgi:hypothetical protein